MQTPPPTPDDGVYRFAMPCPRCHRTGYVNGHPCPRCHTGGMIARPHRGFRFLLVIFPFALVSAVLVTLILVQSDPAAAAARKNSMIAALNNCNPTPSTVFIDELGDLSHTAGHSANWYPDATNAVWYADPLHPKGDGTRLARFPAATGLPLGPEFFYYHAIGASKFTVTIWHQQKQGSTIVDLAWTDEKTNPTQPGGFNWHATTFILTDSMFTLTTKGWGYFNVTLTMPVGKDVQDVLFMFDPAATDGAQWANQVSYAKVDYR